MIVAPVALDDETAKHDQYDLGQATMAMLMAATDLGIGTGHSAIGDQAKAGAILGIPDTHFAAFLIGVGYPAGKKLAPLTKIDRRPFDEVMHDECW